ncbi:hypothetical protein [Rhizobium sp. Root1203]|uniref:hypothetical protein n=1 Tax=Rhizobium sp. Root1203 TaxID=1736427 RepID=UPI000AF15DBF|nr:hypothetical protein [Rhizobium sp. Root1203]
MLVEQYAGKYLHVKTDALLNGNASTARGDRWAPFGRGKGARTKPRCSRNIGRWKSVIGDRLHAKNIENQTTETHIAAGALNRMSALGRANYERVG